MKDFKSYSQQNEQNKSGDKAGADEGQFNSTVELVNILTKAMNGKSQGQIFKTILSEAERGKREGTLSNSDLDNFYTAISPLLDTSKRKKLKEIITRLKDI